MFCPHGHETLDKVFVSLDGWIQHIVTDEGLKRSLPDWDLTNERSLNVTRGWIHANVFNRILYECESLTITSPQGFSLKVSNMILARASDYGEDIRRSLGIEPYETDYFFINSNLFVISTTFWENGAGKIVKKKYENLDVEDSDFLPVNELAQALKKFEGWGVSIPTNEIPDTEEKVEALIGTWWVGAGREQQTTELRPRGRPGKVSDTAKALSDLYPNLTDRPSWKNVHRALAQKGLDSSHSTVVRAWRELVDQKPPL